jgi:putative ABC transport system substrate-binding protein
VRRRGFIALVGGVAAAWPLGARAQQLAIPVMGLLGPGSKVESKRFYDGLPLGMQQHGYLEGRDYILESRYADGDFARLPLLAKELVQLKPLVIVAGTTNAAVAARKQTETIPIVGVNLFDPVGNGLVDSEARPGTNVTGTLLYLPGMAGKQLELARDLIPGITRVGVLANRDNQFSMVQRKESEEAATKLGMNLTTVNVSTAEEITAAFQTFVREGATAVSVLRDALFLAIREKIAAVALASRLPTIYGIREHVESGGLISYGIDLHESYVRAAFYVDRILKGEKAGNLPIEFPTKLELVINLRTAKALGLDVPLFLRQRADEVIE